MAGGGIVAFADRGLVEDPLAYLSGMTPEALAADQARIDEIKANETPTQRKEREQRERDRQAMGSSLSNIAPAAKDIATLPGRAVAGAFESGVTRPLRAVGVPIPYLPESFYGGDRTSMTPFMDKLRKETAARATQTAPAIQKFPDEFPEESASVNAGTQTPPQAPPQGAQPGINTLPSGARPSAGTGQPSLRDVQAMAGAPSAAQPESAMDRYARMLEAQGEDSAKARKDAKAMAIIQAGLGMMGGTSPNAFANIAAGAMPAIQGYQQALQGLRKDDRERIGKLMEMGISKEKLGLELKKLGIEDKKADAMVNLYNARAGAAGSGGGGDDNKKNIAYNTATTSYNKTVGDIDKAIIKLQDDPLYKLGGKSPAKQGIQDRIDALERNKANAYRQYRGYVTDRLNIDIPDFSDPSGGGLPMPKTKSELKTGEIYNTAKGPAKWDGTQFVSGK
jgi:hypothetical protein